MRTRSRTRRRPAPTPQNRESEQCAQRHIQDTHPSGLCASGLSAIAPATTLFGVRLVSAAVIGSIALTGMGCSAMRSRPPLSVPLHSLSDCSRSKAPPFVDVGFTAGSAGAAALSFGVVALQANAAGNERAPSWDPHTKSGADNGAWLTFGLLATAAAVGFAASAHHGFESAAACREAIAELKSRTAPGYFGQPPASGPPGFFPPSANPPPGAPWPYPPPWWGQPMLVPGGSAAPGTPPAPNNHGQPPATSVSPVRPDSPPSPPDQH